MAVAVTRLGRILVREYEHLVIFPVHPTTLTNDRKSFRPSGAEWFRFALDLRGIVAESRRSKFGI
jgi:hypothetical protein